MNKVIARTTHDIRKGLRQITSFKAFLLSTTKK